MIQRTSLSRYVPDSGGIILPFFQAIENIGKFNFTYRLAAAKLKRVQVHPLLTEA